MMSQLVPGAFSTLYITTSLLLWPVAHIEEHQVNMAQRAHIGCVTYISLYSTIISYLIG